MSESDSFADTPPSITELRSNKEGNGAIWTPRDALIAALRALDRGEIKPEALIVCIREPGSGAGKVTSTYYNASPDAHVAYGLLHATLHKLAEGA